MSTVPPGGPLEPLGKDILDVAPTGDAGNNPPSDPLSTSDNPEQLYGEGQGDVGHWGVESSSTKRKRVIECPPTTTVSRQTSVHSDVRPISEGGSGGSSSRSFVDEQAASRGKEEEVQLDTAGDMSSSVVSLSDSDQQVDGDRVAEEHKGHEVLASVVSWFITPAGVRRAMEGKALTATHLQFQCEFEGAPGTHPVTLGNLHAPKL